MILDFEFFPWKREIKETTHNNVVEKFDLNPGCNLQFF